MSAGPNIELRLTRAEIVGLVLRLTLFGAITYYGIRWMVDALDPTRKQKIEAQKRAEKIMKKIGVKGVTLTEYELTIAAHLVDPVDVSVSWTHIGGLDHILDDLKENIIFPYKNRNLFKQSRLIQPPKGILLYGPPGCGKTMVAKATAKAAGFRFVNLQLSSLTDKWYGESQKLADAVFSLARKIEPTIIFIDEIDSFLRSRMTNDHEVTAMMKAQFMSLWDGLITDSDCQVIVMGATNRPQDVDLAILRRMPLKFHIDLPDVKQRQLILEKIVAEEQLDSDVDLTNIAEIAVGFSGSDLHEVCRNAAVLRIRDYVRIFDDLDLSPTEPDRQPPGSSGQLRPISANDLMESVYKLKDSRKRQTLSLGHQTAISLD